MRTEGSEGFIADVFSAPGTWPAYFLDGGVGLEFRGGDAGSEGGDTEHTAAIGVDFAIDQGGSSVEDFDIGDFGGGLETGDFLSFFIFTGIAFAGDDDADGRSGVPLGWRDFIESTIGGGFEDIDEVAL